MQTAAEVENIRKEITTIALLHAGLEKGIYIEDRERDIVTGYTRAYPRGVILYVRYTDAILLLLLLLLLLKDDRRHTGVIPDKPQ